MAPVPPPLAKQMLLPDAMVADDEDEPMYGKWLYSAPDDLSDPSCNNRRASVYANSCFKMYSSLGNYSKLREIISLINDSPQEVTLSGSDPLSLRSKFEITLIGRGNFGAVFKATNKQDNESYAIKTIVEKLEDGKKREEAMKEVHIWKSLGAHENLVGMIDHCIEGDNLYIQMELCECCLSEKTKHFNYGETKKLLYQLSNALEFIHGRCIAHLDVKPANIYFSNDVYKIGDLGCAQFKHSKRVIGGDDRYMPDEMLNGSYEDLEKVDVFSLGASCYELITGNNPRDDVFALPPTFPKEFGHLIKSMIHPDPKERPSLEEILTHNILDK